MDEQYTDETLTMLDNNVLFEQYVINGDEHLREMDKMLTKMFKEL